MYQQMATGAGIGAGTGAAMFTEVPPEEIGQPGAFGERKAIQTGLGGALGVAAPAVARPLGKALAYGAQKTLPAVQKLGAASKRAYNAMTRSAAGAAPMNAAEQKAVTETLEPFGVNWANLSDESKALASAEAQAQMQAGTGIDPKAIANKVLLNEQGFTGRTAPMRAQITRDPIEWGAQMDIMNSPAGAPVKRRWIGQQAKLAQHADDLINKIQSEAGTPEQASQNVFDAILDSNRKMSKEVGRLYDEAAERGVSEISTNWGAVNEVIGEAVDWGMTFEGKNPVAFAKTTMDKLGPNPTTKQIEAGFRRRLMDGWPGMKPETRYWTMKLVNAIDDDVAAAGDDVFRSARSAYKESRRQFEDKVYQTILGDKANEFNFMNRYVWNARVKDLQGLRDTLLNPSKILPEAERVAALERGTQAWRDVKAQTLARLFDKAVKGTDDGVMRFEGNAFAKEMDKITLARLREIFTPAELQSLSTLRETSRLLTSPVQHAHWNYSGTGQYIEKLTDRFLTASERTGIMPGPARGLAAGAQEILELPTGKERIAAAVMEPTAAIPPQAQQIRIEDWMSQQARRARLPQMGAAAAGAMPARVQDPGALEFFFGESPQTEQR
jgi:hypothetical protein